MVDIGGEVRVARIDAPAGARGRPRPLLEVVGLLAAPVLVFFLLGVQGMTNTNIEDQHFYQAYAEHGDDLMLRLGDYRYYWVRLAFILPARVSYDLFGAVRGFFVLRYLLVLIAIVPAYLLLRRLHGVAAGWIVVAAILASPVLIYAWGTDYPDSSAVSYLIAGTACLFMPVRGDRVRRGRIGWLVGSGVAYSLAIHSQFVSGPLVAVAALTYLALQVRPSWRQALLAAVVLLACAAVVTGVLSLIAYVMWGRADIISPTIRAALHFRTKNELRKWHSRNWHWVLRATYVIVPLLTPLLWALATYLMPKARRVATATGTQVEAGIALVAFLQMGLFTYLQFFAITSELEYHVYSSMLWSSTELVMALTIVRLCGPLLASRRTSWLPAALVLAVPYGITFFRTDVHFELLAGLAVSAVLMIVISAGGWWRETVSTRFVAAGLAGVLVAVTVGATYLMTTAEPPGLAWLYQQRHFPEPNYAHALRNGGAWQVQEDEYALAAKFNKTMPQATAPGQTLLTWFGDYDPLSSDISAQYLWTPQSLNSDLPDVSPLDTSILTSRHDQTLVLLAPNAVEFPAAVSSLEQQGFPTAVSLREQLTSGSLTEAVWVLTMGPRHRT